MFASLSKCYKPCDMISKTWQDDLTDDHGLMTESKDLALYVGSFIYH